MNSGLKTPPPMKVEDTDWYEHAFEELQEDVAARLREDTELFNKYLKAHREKVQALVQLKEVEKIWKIHYESGREWLRYVINLERQLRKASNQETGKFETVPRAVKNIQKLYDQLFNELQKLSQVLNTILREVPQISRTLDIAKDAQADEIRYLHTMRKNGERLHKGLEQQEKRLGQLHERLRTQHGRFRKVGAELLQRMRRS